MAESYEVVSQRTGMDLDASGQNLIDIVEITAKAKPSGAVFTVRMPFDGFTESAADAELAAKAATLNNVANL